MSRQTARAEERNRAKVKAHEVSVAARKASRMQKGLTTLSTTQTTGYPKSRYVPHEVRGKSYPFSSRRQHARYATVAA